MRLGLSEETQLDDFTKQGFLVIKSFFSREECESLREISRDHESYKLKTFLPLMNPHKEDPRFLTLLRKEKLHKVLESFVGVKFEVFKRSSFIVTRAPLVLHGIKIIFMYKLNLQTALFLLG